MKITMITNYPVETSLFAIIITASVVLFWWKRSAKIEEAVQLGFLVLTAFSLLLITAQINKNSESNLAAIRAQLYGTEKELAQEEVDDDAKGANILFSTYAIVDFPIEPDAYATLRISASANTNAADIPIKSEALQKWLYGLDAPVDARRADLRRACLHMQNIMYHMHNAFDYHKAKILSPNEWKTWKGNIAEMGPHPLLLASIWEGYKYDYFSRDFAQYLQDELFGVEKGASKEKIARQNFNKRVIGICYPEMTNSSWPIKLPSY